MKVYILDTRQIVGNCAMFWADKGCGYTTELDKAGLFEPGHSDRDTDVEVPEDLARQCTVTHVRIERLREEMDKRGLPMRGGRRGKKATNA